MDNEMIERVARAIKDDWLTNNAKDIDQFFNQLTIAAIKAMREPTEKMIEAGKWCYIHGSADSYRAMIDAITND